MIENKAINIANIIITNEKASGKAIGAANIANIISQIDDTLSLLFNA